VQQRLLTVLDVLTSMFKTSAQLRLENLALRQQLTVLRRSAPKRLKLTRADRIFWVWLRRVWSDWKSVLMIVKADTVIAWHRKGFRLFWTWRIHRGKPGRPRVPQEIRELIRMLSRNNPGWGAPRIHGELLKLGIEITEPTVAKYMVRYRKPPSQTWRTFLENHMKTMVSVDFFIVPTIRFEILYVFLVLAHERRRIVHFAVTAHPTAEWTAQQLREAFPWDSAPQYLLRDRDRIFGQDFVDQVKAMGIKQVLFCAAISLAEGLYRTAHWFPSPRVSGSHHRVRRALSPSCPRLVRFLLPQLAHSSVARQRRPAIPTNTGLRRR